MAVRTEKIQALTGSAPLTLPTSLPTSNKGIQVSTTGVLSTPATATTLSGLSSGGNSDWILFDHLEQDVWATSMKVSANGNGSYAAGDIYCWEVKFHILHGRNGRNTMTGYWAPYSGDTNMTMFSNTQSLDQIGCGFYNGTQYYASAGNPNANTPYDGYEFSLAQFGQDFNMSKNTNYSNRFSASETPWGGSGIYGADGPGMHGSFRYYNGNVNRGKDINMEGITISTESSYGGGQKYWEMYKPKRNNASVPASLAAPIDGFRVIGQGSNYKFCGWMQLWGMPKAVT
tara:strand:+ start:2494 stop:3354 length:861 start_codon:yes stop_codon:yes gene_type:complete